MVLLTLGRSGVHLRVISNPMVPLPLVEMCNALEIDIQPNGAVNFGGDLRMLSNSTVSLTLGDIQPSGTVDFQYML